MKAGLPITLMPQQTVMIQRMKGVNGPPRTRWRTVIKMKKDRFSATLKMKEMETEAAILPC